MIEGKGPYKWFGICLTCHHEQTVSGGVIVTEHACIAALCQVVDDLTPESYAEFLEERAVIVEEQKAELQAKREAKLLRTAS